MIRLSKEEIIEILHEIQSKHCLANSKQDRGIECAIELIRASNPPVYEDDLK